MEMEMQELLLWRLSGLCRHAEWLEEKRRRKEKFTGKVSLVSPLPCNHSCLHSSLNSHVGSEKAN